MAFDSSGQVMFDSIIAYNQGEYVAAFGGYNEQADTVNYLVEILYWEMVGLELHQ